VIAACSSSGSTGPAPVTPAQVAEKFDSVYSSLLAAGTETDSELAVFVAWYSEAAPAWGASQANLTVTTGSGAQTWHGVAYSALDGGADTVYFLTLYPNLNLQQMIFVGLEYSNGLNSELIYGTNNGFTSYAMDSTFTATSAQTLSTGGACSLQNGLAADSTISALWPGASCVGAQLEFTVSVAFAAAANFGSMSTVSISNATFSGAQITSSGPSRVVGIPSKGAAAALAIETWMHTRR
jgi:hypothetical protein